jgi:hypothetical protein
MTRLRQKTRTLLTLSAALVLSGCGDGSDEAEASAISDATARTLSGVYELTRFTRNDTACDVEGPSVMAEFTDGFFVMASTTVFGTRILELASCSSVEDCQSKAIQMQNLGSYRIQYSFTLSSELDPTHLAGFSASTGSSLDGEMCTGREYTDHTLTVADGGVVLESRTKLLADRPQEDGFCMVRPADSKSEARSVPCSELQVLAGTKVAELR